MTFEEALDILETIAEIYPKFIVTEKKIEILIPELEKMDYDRVMSKLSSYITAYSFPPTLADIAAYPPEENKHLALVKQWKAEAALVSDETKRRYMDQFDQLLKRVKRP